MCLIAVFAAAEIFFYGLAEILQGCAISLCCVVITFSFFPIQNGLGSYNLFVSQLAS